ncbi:MAG: Ig-like domain-containing protein, partial [Chloroflexota bacterium]
FLPYAFPRDNDPLNLPVGNYQLTATAYSTDGTAGPPLILNFSVIVGTDTPPEIVSTDPEPDAAIVPDANIMLTFSKPVDVGLSGNWLTISCTPSNTNLTASDTTVTVSNSRTEFFIKPVNNLMPDDICTMTVIAGQVENAFGGTMESDYTFDFSVEIPRIENFYLVDLSEDGDGTIVRVLEDGDFVDLELVTYNWNIRAEIRPDVLGSVVFGISGDAALNLATVDNTIPYDVLDAGNPLNLPPGDYQLIATPYTQSGGVGNVGQSAAINFSVGYGIEPPRIVSTTPLSNEPFVHPETDIQLMFSKMVNVNGEWFSISCIPTNQTFSVGDSGIQMDLRSIVVNPATNLEPGDTCTVTIFAAQVTDRQDQPMESDFIFSFTVGDGRDREDVNRDNLISPTDAISVINRIGEVKDANNAAADVDNDGDIDVDDLNAVVSRIGESVSE